MRALAARWWGVRRFGFSSPPFRGRIHSTMKLALLGIVIVCAVLYLHTRVHEGLQEKQRELIEKSTEIQADRLRDLEAIADESLAPEEARQPAASGTDGPSSASRNAAAETGLKSPTLRPPPALESPALESPGGLEPPPRRNASDSAGRGTMAPAPPESPMD